ncbi:MAG: hypothetical protein KDI27_08705 [Gammaproteobacteria bacterium]|nr:hypothetical protein [Gammaproteobacteria bacterium]
MRLYTPLIGAFALLNGIIFYMFILHLPFGADAFLLSLAHWNKLSPMTEVAALLGAVIALGGVLLTRFLDEQWKNRLLYWRWEYPHPAFNAFLTTRKQPFETSELLAAFPEVRDSGFNHSMQLQTWHRLYPKYQDHPVILSTYSQWLMQRDFYLIALLFLLLFLLAWPVNRGIPFNLVSAYLFIYGAQFLFLLFMARRVGLRLVDNLLGVALGVDQREDKGSGGRRTI